MICEIFESGKFSKKQISSHLKRDEGKTQGVEIYLVNGSGFILRPL